MPPYCEAGERILDALEVTESAGDARPLNDGVADCARLSCLRRLLGGGIARDLSPLRGGLNMLCIYRQLRGRVAVIRVKNGISGGMRLLLLKMV